MYIIGITGGSGSGKTTFAKKIINRIDPGHVAIMHLDSYYLNTIPEKLITPAKKPNFDHPDSFDWTLLREHLINLKNGDVIASPIYDFETNTRTSETQEIGPVKLVLFEGIFTLFHPEIRDLMDIKCFLHVDADIRFTRRLHRDVNERGRSLESVIAQYYDSVRPMYQKFLEPQKQYADFIVGEETDVAADILSAKLKELLND